MAELHNPPSLAKPRGYAHAASARGRVVALAGQIGWDEHEKLVSREVAPQFEKALANLVVALAGARGKPEDLIALRIFVTDKKKYLAALKEVGAAYRAHLGKHFPAMSLVEVADLLEDGALVEIEGLGVVND